MIAKGTQEVERRKWYMPKDGEAFKYLHYYGALVWIPQLVMIKLKLNMSALRIRWAWGVWQRHDAGTGCRRISGGIQYTNGPNFSASLNMNGWVLKCTTLRIIIKLYHCRVLLSHECRTHWIFIGMCRGRQLVAPFMTDNEWGTKHVISRFRKKIDIIGFK